MASPGNRHCANCNGTLEVFLNDMLYINPRFTYLLTYNFVPYMHHGALEPCRSAPSSVSICSSLFAGFMVVIDRQKDHAISQHPYKKPASSNALSAGDAGNYSFTVAIVVFSTNIQLHLSGNTFRHFI